MKFSHILFCVFAFVAPQTLSEELTDHPDMLPHTQAITEAFEEVDWGFCPGLEIAASCGDFICEEEIGEDAQTCPSDCTTYNISSYNSLPICYDVKLVYAPENSAEVAAIIQQAIATDMRVRVVGARHSASTTICGGEITISTELLTDVGQITIEDDVAIIPAGVNMGVLGDFLHEQGYSIGYTHPGFREATVAGALATSAHGSSPIHSNSLSHRLAFIEMVDANGEIRTFAKEATSEIIWRALQTHLGYLGVITKVGLKIDPTFNLDTQFSWHSEEALFTETGPLDLLKDCDWGEINWFPGQQQFWQWCGKKTTEPAQRGAENRLLDIGLPPSLVPQAKELFHASTCSNDLLCVIEAARYNIGKWLPPMVVENEYFGEDENVSHAVGVSHKMMSSQFPDLGHNHYFQMEWEVAVPKQHIQAALEEVKTLFDLNNVCLPAVGVFLRFGLIEDGGFLTYHGAGGDFKPGETAMFFEMPITLPAGTSSEDFESWIGIYRDITLMLIENYGARAHWAKNSPAILAAQLSKPNYQERMALFNQAVAILDPTGRFSNTYGEEIGVQWPNRKTLQSK